MLLSLSLLFGVFASVGNAPVALTAALVGAMVLGAALAHLFIALAVRCESCKRRVGWIVLSTAGMQWLAELWRTERCPVCGDPEK